MKILILYATRKGMTAKTAQLMANLLIQNYNHSVVVDEKKLSKRSEEDLRNTDLVIVGSSIMAGAWKGGPKKFLKKFGPRIKRLAVFVTAGGIYHKVLSEGEDRFAASAQAVSQYIAPLKQKYGFSTLLDGGFGGRMGSDDNLKFDDWDAEQIRLWVADLEERLAASIHPYVIPHSDQS